MTLSGAALAPNLYTNSQSFFGANVSAANTLAAPLYNNDQAFFSHTVSAGAVDPAPDLFTNNQIFFAPTVSNGDQSSAAGGSRKKRKRAPLKFLYPVYPQWSDGVAVVGSFAVTASLGESTADGEVIIDGSALFMAEALVCECADVSAESSWNDLSDDELMLVLDLVLA